MSTPDDMGRAGDYVLGLMEPEAQAAFEADMLRDPALAAQVDLLARRMGALDDTAEPAPVSAGLWERLADQLDAHPQVAPLRPAAPTAAATPTAPRREKRADWRLLPMAASVLVAAGLGYLTGWQTRPLPEPGAPVVVAVLLSEGTQVPGAIIEAFADDSVRVVPLENFIVPEGRVLELWTLPNPATGPVSLGRFDSPRSIVLSGPNLPRPASGQLYEITLEPAPGSPTGRPTGPILVKGLAQQPPEV
ncbi:Anti-sigma-K factor RskA [Devosia enhydra]|uniref:Anti-sigma-K factor RskA n=1 Tax=Devosia enhydra TaxID=665118 RepID=A0A1K2I261_9HYPH|nr:anti-sigma factor [Devosia enhydra]SFZ86482.1 Anti-sigma-K factor RskA [Devosia enhydra]